MQKYTTGVCCAKAWPETCFGLISSYDRSRYAADSKSVESQHAGPHPLIRGSSRSMRNAIGSRSSHGVCRLTYRAAPDRDPPLLVLERTERPARGASDSSPAQMSTLFRLAKPRAAVVPEQRAKCHFRTRRGVSALFRTSVFCGVAKRSRSYSRSTSRLRSRRSWNVIAVCSPDLRLGIPDGTNFKTAHGTSRSRQGSIAQQADPAKRADKSAFVPEPSPPPTSRPVYAASLWTGRARRQPAGAAVDFRQSSYAR